MRSFRIVPHRLLGLLIALALSCTFPKGNQTYLSTMVTVYPAYPLEAGSKTIVLANAFDVQAMKYRDNKEKQFQQLIEHTLRHMNGEIKKRSDAEVLIEDRKPTIKIQSDSLKQYMSQLNATHAILITAFNAYFDQTEVVVTETESGKNREAFYDLVVEIGYDLRYSNQPGFDTLISLRKFHSSRSVLSGLLAAGPNIVSNTEDVVDGIHANVNAFLKNFFVQSESRTRYLFTSGTLNPVAEAIVLHDYETALNVSKEVSSTPDLLLAAQAFYNCAALSEYKRDYGYARHYLQEALKLYPLQEARAMWIDYEHQ
ncbi:MAG: hypothetical protein ABL895_04830 [Cyclobacteriaceae bacterium]